MIEKIKKYFYNKENICIDVKENAEYRIKRMFNIKTNKKFINISYKCECGNVVNGVFNTGLSKPKGNGFYTLGGCALMINYIDDFHRTQKEHKEYCTNCGCKFKEYWASGEIEKYVKEWL